MTFPVRITAIYLIVSIAWIATSNDAATALFSSSDLPTVLSYKRWIFVAFTAIMLYLFLAQETRRREQNETLLRQQKDSIKRLKQAIDQSPASVIVLSNSGHIEYVNKPFESMSGYTRKEVLNDGVDPLLFNSGKTPPAIYEQIWDLLNAGHEWKGELINRHKNGTSYWVRARITPVSNEAGVVTHYLAVEEDITSEKSQETLITNQVNYDNLTELPSRFLAMDRMGQSINAAIRNNLDVAVMYIDLDDFSSINNEYGHEAGDDAIALCAGRIVETVRQTDTVARYGEDEYLVILNQIESSNDAPRIAEKILAAIARPIMLGSNSVSLTASIGIASFPEDGQDPNELMRHANSAMFAAKESGGGRYEFYSAEMTELANMRLAMEHRLIKAVENNEFSLQYQPVIDLESNSITQVEVLLRWYTPDLGEISTDDFIPLAEDTGLIIPIGEWVIQEACQQLQNWRAQAGLENLSMTLNISPRQFGDINLLKCLNKALEAAGVPAQAITLEVQETLLERNQQGVGITLKELRSKGFKVALDNFCTGPSSLSHLKTFKFDTLKIDPSMISQLESHAGDKAFIETAITLAKGLDMKVVGGGVETAEQFDYLREHKVSQVQGFWFSRPLAASDIKAYIDNFQAPG